MQEKQPSGQEIHVTVGVRSHIHAQYLQFRGYFSLIVFVAIVESQKYIKTRNSSQFLFLGTGPANFDGSGKIFTSGNSYNIILSKLSGIKCYMVISQLSIVMVSILHFHQVFYLFAGETKKKAHPACCVVLARRQHKPTFSSLPPTTVVFVTQLSTWTLVSCGLYFHIYFQ